MAVRESSGPPPDTSTTDTTADLVVHVPDSARVWALLGRLAPADQGYVDISELRTRRPDLERTDGIAVQFGAIQTEFAACGLVPGGATLPEVALRSRLDRYDPTQLDADEHTSLTTAVELDQMREGLDRLLRAEDSTLTPTDGADSGWLFCPRARRQRHRFDWVGGVTWDHVGIATSDTHRGDALPDKHAKTRRLTGRLVLRHALRCQDLDGAPDDLIERCLDEPATVRAWIGWSC